MSAGAAGSEANVMGSSTGSEAHVEGRTTGSVGRVKAGSEGADRPGPNGRQKLLLAVALSFLPITAALLLHGPLPLLFSPLVHRLLHLGGALLFLGNVLVSALWLALADASKSLPALRFATRVVNVADLAFTAPGGALALVNGVVLSTNWGGLWALPWLARSLGLFVAITVLWALLLVPLQLHLERAVAALPDGTAELPTSLRRALVGYFVAGGFTAVLAALIGALMVLK